MTPRQRDALTFIEAFIKLHRVSPSIREIAAGIGDRGISTAHKLVNLLVADGYLRRTHKRHRNITVVSPLATASTQELMVELRRRGCSV